jgi:ABC-type multidrug transport system fused ATPase/permease subunit
MAKAKLGESYQLYKRIFNTYMSEHWRKFLIAIAAMVVAALTEPAFARLMKPLIDKGFNDQDQTAMIVTLMLMKLLQLGYQVLWLSVCGYKCLVNYYVCQFNIMMKVILDG